MSYEDAGAYKSFQTATNHSTSNVEKSLRKKPNKMDENTRAETERAPEFLFNELHAAARDEDGRGSKFRHIPNLDKFFTRIYRYHQRNGFICMVVEEFFELLQFSFIIFFSLMLFQCVNYPLLFGYSNSSNRTSSYQDNVHISDVIYPLDQCLSTIPFMLSLCLIIAILYWLFRLVKFTMHVIQYKHMQSFFEQALEIQSSELANYTWYEVLQKVIAAQRKHHMCVHKENLNELDIYQRVLRVENYFVSMLNKSVLPVSIQIPFINLQWVYFTSGYEKNLQLILFKFYGAPFVNSWNLQNDYKTFAKRDLLIRSMRKRILTFGIINLILSPLIFIWQFLFAFFSYADLMKRDPANVGVRAWSNYGRLYLRHFNELPHELKARLNRSYRPAAQYMNTFTSPLLAIIAKNIVFFAGSICVVMFALTIWDEDTLKLEHYITVMTALGLLAAISHAFIPNENAVFNPDALLSRVLCDVHYMPDGWKEQAHTSTVRDEFSKLFQYKFVHILEEILSPIVTPFVLIYSLRNCSETIVDFLRDNTTELHGVGDVCSLGLMDIKKHGEESWLPDNFDTEITHEPDGDRTEMGKTELSLLHFKLGNPQWQANEAGQKFIRALRKKAENEAAELRNTGVFDNMQQSAFAVSMQKLGSRLYPVLSNSMDNSDHSTGLSTYIGKKSNIFGPPNINEQHCESILTNLVNTEKNSMLQSMTQTNAPLYPTLAHTTSTTLEQQQEEASPSNFTAVDMSLSALYLHELHHRKRGRISSHRATQYSPLQKEVRVVPDVFRRPSTIVEEHIVQSPSNIFNPTSRRDERQPLIRNDDVV